MCDSGSLLKPENKTNVGKKQVMINEVETRNIKKTRPANFELS